MSRSKVFWMRKAHRYLGLIVGAQLLLWTAGGLYFSWNSITKVRGEHLVREAEPANLAAFTYAPPGPALQGLAAREPAPETVLGITVRTLFEQPIYEIKYRAGGQIHYALADARTGELRPAISEAEAVALARADFARDAELTAVTQIHSAAADSEYRGGDLPAYKVTFAHPTATNIYVSAERGLVRARRNSTWRMFDFLWMLHILDFETRGNMNNLLLQVLSLLGLITITSGYVLWAGTSPLLRRRRKHNPPAGPGSSAPS